MLELREFTNLISKTQHPKAKMENMQNMGMGAKNICKCPHHKTIPVLVVLFGLNFLLANWGVINWDTANTIWPVLVILAGLMKIGEKSGMCKCC